MKLSKLVLTIVVLVWANASAAQGTGSAGASAKEVLAKYERALAAKDVSLASTIISHDPDVVFISGGGLKSVGWTRIKQGLEEFYSVVTKLEHRDVAVKTLASGKAAVLTCDQILHAERDGKPFQTDAIRMTWVLENQSGDWRIVHAHWSIPAKAQDQ